MRRWAGGEVDGPGSEGRTDHASGMCRCSVGEGDQVGKVVRLQHRKRGLKGAPEAEHVRSACIWGREDDHIQHRGEMDVVGCRPPLTPRRNVWLSAGAFGCCGSARSRHAKGSRGGMRLRREGSGHLTLLGRERQACDGCAGATDLFSDSTASQHHHYHPARRTHSHTGASTCTPTRRHCRRLSLETSLDGPRRSSQQRVEEYASAEPENKKPLTP